MPYNLWLVCVFIESQKLIGSHEAEGCFSCDSQFSDRCFLARCGGGTLCDFLFITDQRKEHDTDPLPLFDVLWKLEERGIPTTEGSAEGHGLTDLKHGPHDSHMTAITKSMMPDTRAFPAVDLWNYDILV